LLGGIEDTTANTDKNAHKNKNPPARKGKEEKLVLA
jgi:hypothetical protein